ncbi:hypothetical protein [Pseudomonas syringae]|uniref:hypothetical protein n=1 Tax=Pseudomonas syringae TaxID=317 RepID=UPI001F1045D7|nr:hypothetical protein [Pseudomonas syringae]MCH5639207.1 hypothetical protein [Pseudomonas syringae pv. syringae]
MVASYETAWYDFVTVALGNLGIEQAHVFQADFSKYISTKSIVADAVSVFGEELDQFCHRVNSVKIRVVILKNLEVNIDSDYHNEAYASAEYIQRSCPEVKVIVVFSYPPLLLCPHLITLQPLTEGQCVSYIRKHPLGSFATDHEINSGSIFLYTEGLPEAIDKLLRIKQHDDLLEIYLSGLRTVKKTEYYPSYLVNIIDHLRDEDDAAFDLLVVLTLFPMGESIHSVRYFHPKKKLNGKFAVKLEDLGLVSAKTLTSEALDTPEPYRIVSVHRLIREYICDCVLPNLQKTDYESYLMLAVSLYFGEDWKSKKYKLSGNFLSDKLRLGMVMAGNARFILMTLLSRAEDEVIDSPKKVSQVLDLIFFYVAKLTSTLNFRHVTDLLGDISLILDRYSHLVSVQEIRHCYIYAYRMQGAHELAIAEYLKMGKIESISLFSRTQIELAYCKVSVGDDGEALRIASDLKASNCSIPDKLHGRLITILASNPYNKLPRLEKLAKDARARKAFSLSNHVKSCLIRYTRNKDQKIALLRSAATLAHNDSDSLNFIRNTVDMAECIVDLGQELSGSDINNLIDCYHFAHVQRSKILFERIHNLLWGASKSSGNFDRMLELYIRASALGQILKFENNEKSHLIELLNSLAPQVDYVNDKRLVYVLHRAVEMNLVAEESLPSVLIENTTNFFLENPELE